MDTAVLSQLIEEKQFKPLVAYLKLARDCLTTNPLVSYWSLYYVLEQGIKTPAQDDNYRRCLGNIMTCLEKEKTARKGDPLFGNEQEAKKYIENYANQLLLRAENEAELGVSPSVALKIYLACSNVSQLLTLFGDNSEENSKRIKYSKWKAVNIAKEIKSGGAQPPQPPPASSNNEGGFDDGYSGGYEPYNPPTTNQNEEDNDNFSDFYNQSQPSGPKPNSPAPQSAPEPELNFANLTLNDSDSKKAELLCESALYAIRNNDILSAVTSLKQTLQVLQKHARSN